MVGADRQLPWQATKVDDGPEIDLSTWSWGVDFEQLVGMAVTDVLRKTFRESPPTLALNHRYAEGEPLSLILGLPLASCEDDEASWTISISSLADDLIESFWRPGLGSISQEDGDAYIRPVATALRELADQLECAIETKQEAP